MTCAGIGAVALALDMLEEGDASVEGRTSRCCRPQRQQATVDQALAWLAQAIFRSAAIPTTACGPFITCTGSSAPAD